MTSPPWTKISLPKLKNGLENQKNENKRKQTSGRTPERGGVLATIVLRTVGRSVLVVSHPTFSQVGMFSYSICVFCLCVSCVYLSWYEWSSALMVFFFFFFFFMWRRVASVPSVRAWGLFLLYGPSSLLCVWRSFDAFQRLYLLYLCCTCCFRDCICLCMYMLLHCWDMCYICVRCCVCYVIYLWRRCASVSLYLCMCIGSDICSVRFLLRWDVCVVFVSECLCQYVNVCLCCIRVSCVNLFLCLMVRRECCKCLNRQLIHSIMRFSWERVNIYKISKV